MPLPYFPCKPDPGRSEVEDRSGHGSQRGQVETSFITFTPRNVFVEIFKVLDCLFRRNLF